MEANSLIFKPSHRSVRTSRGIALIVAMFALLILSLIGLALLSVSSTEILINQNSKSSRAAYFAAEAGTEEARFRLMTTGGNAIPPPGNTTSAIYIRANTSIDPTSGSASTNPYFDPEYSVISNRDNNGTQTTRTSGLTSATFYTTIQGSTNQVPFAWVKITRKTETLAGQTVDNDSTNNTTAVYFGGNTATGVTSQYVRDATNSPTHNGNPVYLVTSMSLDSGGAQRKIQTEVVVPPPVPVTAAVNSYNDVDFSGTLNISGNDECNGGATQVYGVSSHGSIDSTNPAQTVIGLPPPPPAAVTGPSTCPNCPFGYDVPTLIDMYKNSPIFQSVNSAGTNISCSGSPTSCSGSNVVLGTPPNVPPPGSPTNTPVPGYYYSPGNLSITSNNSVGYGILIVDGDVTMDGGVYFEGIIIARGTFNFTGGGGNNINIRGAVVAGQSITDTTSDLGGSIEVQYNSCSILNVYNQMPMTVLTFKDRALY
jgi:Tfp pilus assembly protein PilX